MMLDVKGRACRETRAVRGCSGVGPTGRTWGRKVGMGPRVRGDDQVADGQRGPARAGMAASVLSPLRGGTDVGSFRVDRERFKDGVVEGRDVVRLAAGDQAVVD